MPVNQPQHVSKDHHYVPVFVLKNFTSTDTNPGKLCSFDSEVGRFKWNAPRSVAKEEHFYTVAIPGKSPDFIEGHFGKVESRAADTLRGILADRRMPEGQVREEFMLFLALMFSRGPAFRELVLDASTAPLELTLRWAAASPENHEAYFRDFPEERRLSYDLMQRWAKNERMVMVKDPSSEHAMSVMHSMSGGVDLLGQRQWTLMFAGEDADFICSDKPVSLEPTKSGGRIVPHGLIHNDNDFILPVHRKLALLGRGKGRAQVCDVDRRVVALVNRRTMLGAWRYVYAPDEEFVILDDAGDERPGSYFWLNVARHQRQRPQWSE